MTALPPTSDFNGISVTEGQCKAAFSDLRDYLAGLLGSDGVPTSAQAALEAMMASTAVKTAAYTVVTADQCRVLDASGTWTLALTAATTLGIGFCFAIRNSGTGVVTIDPAGSELINNATTARLAAGQAVFVFCNGTAWFTIGGLGDDAAAFQAITGRAIQSNASDTTAGRLLTVKSVMFTTIAAMTAWLRDNTWAAIDQAASDAEISVALVAAKAQAAAIAAQLGIAA